MTLVHYPFRSLVKGSAFYRRLGYLATFLQKRYRTPFAG